MTAESLVVVTLTADLIRCGLMQVEPEETLVTAMACYDLMQVEPHAGETLAAATTCCHLMQVEPHAAETFAIVRTC